MMHWLKRLFGFGKRKAPLIDNIYPLRRAAMPGLGRRPWRKA